MKLAIFSNSSYVSLYINQKKITFFKVDFLRLPEPDFSWLIFRECSCACAVIAIDPWVHAY